MENADRRNDLRGVERHAIQMSAFIGKRLAWKLPQIEMLHLGGYINSELHSNVNITMDWHTLKNEPLNLNVLSHLGKIGNSGLL